MGQSCETQVNSCSNWLSADIRENGLQWSIAKFYVVMVPSAKLALQLSNPDPAFHSAESSASSAETVCHCTLGSAGEGQSKPHSCVVAGATAELMSSSAGADKLKSKIYQFSVWWVQSRTKSSCKAKHRNCRYTPL